MACKTTGKVTSKFGQNLSQSPRDHAMRHSAVASSLLHTTPANESTKEVTKGPVGGERRRRCPQNWPKICVLFGSLLKRHSFCKHNKRYVTPVAPERPPKRVHNEISEYKFLLSSKLTLTDLHNAHHFYNNAHIAPTIGYSLLYGIYRRTQPKKALT